MDIRNLDRFFPVETIIDGVQKKITISRDIIGKIIQITKFTYEIVLKNGEEIENQSGKIIFDLQHKMAYDEREPDEDLI